jgi:hypothetical protein
MAKQKKTLYIYMYSGVQTIATNVYTFDKNNERQDIENTRYIVEHVFEIIYPFYEKYAKYNIETFLDGEQLDYYDIEHSYHECMGE